jgi:two-component system, LytTR family, response regulator
MKTLIIEDEHKSRETLAYLLEKYCPDIRICGSTANFEQGYQLFLEEKPELLLIDIHLNAPEGTGLDLVQLIDRSSCAVIFTTGFREYAVDAFRLKAVDYLLKPVRIEHLMEAVQKARNHLGKELPTNKLLPERELFHIPTPSGFQLIRQQDIIRCEADGAYTHLYINGTREHVTTSTNIGQIAPRLNGNFLRIHKSHIINRHFVTGYSKGDALFVKMTDRSEVPVSRTNRDQFFTWLD